MTTVLRLDASARTQRSITRRLADAFISAWQQVEPTVRVVSRDVGAKAPPIVTEKWIAAAFTAPEQRSAEMIEALRPSDDMIAELKQADIIVVAAPLYNYGMPASLKAWVDQVVRVGSTFTFDLSRGDFPIQSVLQEKTMVLLTSRGEFGFVPGGIRDGWDHLGPHLRIVGHRLLGVAPDGFHEIAAEYQEFADERHKASVESALNAAAELARSLASMHAGQGQSHADGEVPVDRPETVAKEQGR